MHELRGEESALYQVVINHEEQYSLIDARDAIPLGWRPVGEPAERTKCLDFIEQAWTDMRPLSLRRQMAELETMKEHQGTEVDHDQPTLIERLLATEHSVRLTFPPGDAPPSRDIITGQFYLLFPNTKGCTEIHFRFDDQLEPSAIENLDNRSGWLHIEGTATLDGVRIFCRAVIAADTLSGTARVYRA